MLRIRVAAVAIVALAVTALLLAACGGGGGGGGKIGGEMILATTTSVNDSGLLDALVPEFEKATGVNVKVVAVGTGAALQMGKDGNADALFVHAPSSEIALVDSGDLINRQVIAYNDFVIVGPAADPAGLKDAPDAVTAMTRIAPTQSRFISRGDDSGTHKRELELWQAASIEPSGDWYEESGQGMGATLTIADQKDAYTLSDRGTFLATGKNLELVIAFEGDPALINLYSVMQVNPSKGNIREAAAKAFVDFMLQASTQEEIGAFRREEFGRALFTPAGGLSDEQARQRFQQETAAGSS